MEGLQFRVWHASESQRQGPNSAWSGSKERGSSHDDVGVLFIVLVVAFVVVLVVAFVAALVVVVVVCLSAFEEDEEVT